MVKIEVDRRFVKDLDEVATKMRRMGIAVPEKRGKYPFVSRMTRPTMRARKKDGDVFL